LVAAVEGCCSAARRYGAPFVSGKDSLNNEYVGTDGHRHAVPPTLVITAVAHLPDADHCITTDLSEPGNILLVIGRTSPEFAGSHLDLLCGQPDEPGIAPMPPPEAPSDYRRLHAAMQERLVEACHDVSEGGLAVAVAEMCIAGRLGATITSLPHDDLSTALFAESCGRLVVEVRPERLDRFLNVMDGRAQVIGRVNDESVLSISGVTPIGVQALVDAFTGGGDR
jgi:phosphoribosylformylglycinamidine synthase